MSARFSARTGWPRQANALAERLAERERRGAEVLDLTLSNPTRAGLTYPEALLGPLADPRGLGYAPEPLGLRSAREAVAGYYAARGAKVDPDAVVLTASTSEAYAFLFKLLCDPGEAVLVPAPSYPLFDYLAGLEAVRTRPYRLAYDGEWCLDLQSAAEAAEGARALLLVSPHNPTGHCLSRAEQDGLCALAAERGLALVSDEVFADYAYAPRAERAGPLCARQEALCFTLSGLSKVSGLPQLKLGWLVVSGPEAERREALERLEVVADTFLSVATPVQLALPGLLAAGEGVRAQLRARVARNRQALLAARPPGAPWDVLRAEAGWYALLAVPRARSEEEWCQALLEQGVWLHPGYFFDLERPGYLVLSLLPEPATFDRALERLAGVLGG